ALVARQEHVEGDAQEGGGLVVAAGRLGVGGGGEGSTPRSAPGRAALWWYCVAIWLAWTGDGWGPYVSSSTSAAWRWSRIRSADLSSSYTVSRTRSWANLAVPAAAGCSRRAA